MIHMAVLMILACTTYAVQKDHSTWCQLATLPWFKRSSGAVSSHITSIAQLGQLQCQISGAIGGSQQ